MRSVALAGLVWLLVSCGAAGGGDADAGTGHDAPAAEAAAPSDAPPAADAAAAADATPAADTGAGDDAGPTVPLAGFGGITGDCGFLTAAAITSPQPAVFSDHVDFGAAGYTSADFGQLSAGAQEVITDGNAGGSSLLSEAFSYDILYRCELAELLKTENEVVYTTTTTKKTDYVVRIDGYRVGVSVTRAFVYPTTNPYTVTIARQLLEGKLADIHVSSANVSAADAWEKQILHVLAYGPEHATAIVDAFALIDATIVGDTILVVTVTDGNDAFIY
ncbi:MAG TPA: hypothetical protein VGQ83_19350 [Polyangia bacterium]|jgi:hypothetical protein